MPLRGKKLRLGGGGLGGLLLEDALEFGDEEPEVFTLEDYHIEDEDAEDNETPHSGENCPVDVA